MFYKKADGLIPLKEQVQGVSMCLTVQADKPRKNIGMGGPSREGRESKAKGPSMLAGITHERKTLGTYQDNGCIVQPWIEIKDGVVTGHNLSSQCKRGHTVRFSRAPDGKINGVVRQNGQPLYG